MTKKKDRDAPPVLRAIVVKLDAFPPNGGGYQVMLRLRHQDKATVDLAAKSLHLSQADFCRAMVVNGARETLNQLGIREPYVSTPYEPQSISGAGNSD